MNILILTDKFPPFSNAGAEKMAYDISKRYAKLGHKVVVITTNNDLKNGTTMLLSYDNLTIYKIGSSYNANLRAYISLYNPLVLKSIRRILDRNHFDFAHLHNIHTHISYSVISLLKDKNIKSILTAHDTMSIEYDKFTQGINKHDLSESPTVLRKVNPFKSLIIAKIGYNPLRNIIIKRYLSKLNKIVAVSSDLELLLNENGIKNTCTIHNGVPESHIYVSESDIKSFRGKYCIKNSENILLFAGRISTEKGMKQVVSLAKMLKDNNYEFKILVTGSIGIIDKEIENCFIYTGWLDEKEMELAFRISDVTLVPSIYPDPFPTVVLESMRAGTPVIATCFGGAKESIVNKETGYIINPFDIGRFYQSVCNAVNNDRKKTNMAIKIKSKEVFKNRFCIKECVNNYFELIDSLL